MTVKVSLFDPEVEAMRASFEQTADALIKLVRVHMGTMEGIDYIPLFSEQEEVIAPALLDHFAGLCQEIDWFDAATIQLFYVDLRLHLEQTRLKYARKDVEAPESANSRKPRTTRRRDSRSPLQLVH